jgi:hypothetical protein
MKCAHGLLRFKKLCVQSYIAINCTDRTPDLGKGRTYPTMAEHFEEGLSLHMLHPVFLYDGTRPRNWAGTRDSSH